mmetsp:Transcript_4330/g.5925  ORF Transcript_4330/g.5925 Transcript_4330/m.5925 type:complete len:453 (-) Transcript_4330:157-1515(-)
MKLSVYLLLPSLATGFVSPIAKTNPTFQVKKSLYKPTSLSAINIDERATRDVAAMDEWAAFNGVQRVEGFQLTTQDQLDYSVMTNEGIAANSPLLYVPEKLILSTAKTKEELGSGPGVADAVSYLGRLGAGAQVPQFYLFLKVLYEYERGEGSTWYPWLNSLPRLFFNSVSMTDFCYECLPPLVFQLARGERVKFDNFYDALQKVGIFSEDVKLDRDLAKWAFNVVYTRSWGPDNDKQIVPMGDMFNHGTETEIGIAYDENGNCNIYTTRDVPPGSPLRMSYGDPTNPSALFATYGFLDETSPATFCKIMNIQPTEELKNLGLDFSRMLFYKDTGAVSEEVWDVLLYAQVLKSNKEAQQAFYQAHMTGDVETKQRIHQHYFYETSSALKTHVDTFLKQLDDLSSKGEGKDLSEHPRLPLILRHNEFVKNTFLKVKESLDPMVAQAAGEVAYS